MYFLYKSSHESPLGRSIVSSVSCCGFLRVDIFFCNSEFVIRSTSKARSSFNIHPFMRLYLSKNLSKKVKTMQGCSNKAPIGVIICLNLNCNYKRGIFFTCSLKLVRPLSCIEKNRVKNTFAARALHSPNIALSLSFSSTY